MSVEIYSPQSLTATFPLQNGEKGRRSFPIGFWSLFRGDLLNFGGLDVRVIAKKIQPKQGALSCVLYLYIYNLYIYTHSYDSKILDPWTYIATANLWSKIGTQILDPKKPPSSPPHRNEVPVPRKRCLGVDLLGMIILHGYICGK